MGYDRSEHTGIADLGTIESGWFAGWFAGWPRRRRFAIRWPRPGHFWRGSRAPEAAWLSDLYPQKRRLIFPLWAKPSPKSLW